MGYAWPGNVRELENVIYEAMVHAEGDRLDAGRPAGPGAIPGPARRRAESRTAPLPRRPARGRIAAGRGPVAADGTAKAMIEKALREAGGNRTEAARRLGISRKTLFNKMKALGLD